MHALYSCYSLAKAFTKHGYKVSDAPHAVHFDLPDDVRSSANISSAFWICDILPTLFVGANDIQTYAHHFFACSWNACCKYFNRGGPGHIHVFYWAEFSTIFLQISWFLRETIKSFDKWIANQQGLKKPLVAKVRSRILKISNRVGILFAIVFFYCRLYQHLFYSPSVAYNLWTFHADEDDTREEFTLMWRIHTCSIILLFNLVNFIWSYGLIKIVSKLLRNGVKVTHAP